MARQSQLYLYCPRQIFVTLPNTREKPGTGRNQNCLWGRCMLILTTLCRGFESVNRFANPAISSLCLILVASNMACSQSTIPRSKITGQLGTSVQSTYSHEANNVTDSQTSKHQRTLAPIPPKVNELVPARENDRFTWIPGYWKWDERHNGFFWIGGVWKSVPKNKRWVNGKWKRTNSGNVWSPGFMEPVKPTESALRLVDQTRQSQSDYGTLNPAIRRLKEERARLRAEAMEKQRIQAQANSNRSESHRNDFSKLNNDNSNQKTDSKENRIDEQEKERQRRLRELQRELEKRRLRESQNQQRVDREQREQTRLAQQQRQEVQRARMERQRAQQQQLSDQQRRVAAQQAERRRNFREFERAKRQTEQMEQRRGN